MSLIDVYPNEFVGNVAGIPVYRPLANISCDELSVTPEDLVLGGGSGEMSANALPIGFAVASAVEFELFDHTWNMSRNFRNFLNSEGHKFSDDDIDNINFYDEDIFDVQWEPNFTGDEWWDIGLLARESNYSHPAYRNIDHWLMVQAGRLYLNFRLDYSVGGTPLEREAFGFAVKRIRSLYPVDTMIIQQ